MMRRSLLLAVALGGLMASPVSAGEISDHTLYMLHCSGCHDHDGSGLPSAGIPPFPGIVGSLLKHKDGRHYLSSVPGVVNSGLPPADLARLLNYVLDQWGGPQRPKNAAPFTGEEVARLRAQPVDDIFHMRQRIAADLRKVKVDIGQFP